MADGGGGRERHQRGGLAGLVAHPADGSPRRATGVMLIGLDPSMTAVLRWRCCVERDSSGQVPARSAGREVAVWNRGRCPRWSGRERAETSSCDPLWSCGAVLVPRWCGSRARGRPLR